jgi:putative hydrolase of the HAD superfamily
MAENSSHPFYWVVVDFKRLTPLVMIRAIIFDFGRVISAQKSPALFARYEKDLGLAPDTINAIMFDSDAWKDALLGRKTAQGFWYAIGPELGLNTVEDIDGFRRRYHADEAMNPGVAELIHRLHGRTKLAVLSNSPPGLVNWLADWNIGHLFDVVFCSGDEGVVKPDPAAFEMTLGRLGVEPKEAVFIDDTLEHVRSAEALGIHGICFTTAEVLWDRLNRFLKSP